VARKAARAFRAFHGHGPTTRRKMSYTVPKGTLFALGDLIEVVYKRPGDKVPYQHRFKKPFAKLCTDARGRRLYIIGGGYRVRSVGIVR
jgi:hypothetical protein